MIVDRKQMRVTTAAASQALEEMSSVVVHLALTCGWLTIKQVAEKKGVSKGSVSDAVRRGAIRAVRALPGDGSGNVAVYLDPADVDDYTPRKRAR